MILIALVPLLLLLLLLWVGWRWVGRRSGAPPHIKNQGNPPPAPSAAALGIALSVLCNPSCGNASVTADAGSNGVSVISATYVGTARDQAALLDATLVMVSGTTNQSLALFGPEVAIEAFEAMKGEAIIWRDGANIGVLLPAHGPVEVRLKLVVGLGGDVSRRWLDLALPPALGSELKLTLPEPDAEIDFPGAVSLTRTTSEEDTVVQAILGASDRLRLEWTPRRKRAADLAATVFAHQTALLTVGAGLINTRTELEWQISQGELQQVRVRLPEGHRLLRVSGEHLRSWDLAGEDRDLLVVDLVKPVSPGVKLVLETERPIRSLPGVLSVSLPEPMDVKRQTGLVAVQATDELGLSIERTAALDRIDNAEFSQAYGGMNIAVVSAWRFLRPDFELLVKAELLRPRMEVTLHEQFTVGLEQLVLRGQVDYSISRVGVFSVRLALPTQGRVERVHCDAMRAWAERDEKGERVIEITLNQKTLGALRLEIEMQRSFSTAPATLELKGVHPLQADKLTGYVAVSAEPGVGLKTASLERAVEIPAAEGRAAREAEIPLLAFKHIALEPQPSATWDVSLDVEALQPWIRAEVVHFVTVGENRVTGRSLVRYDIQNAPTREFRLRVPAEWRNVEIAGSGVRRRDWENGRWSVELQGKVFGTYQLTLHWEAPRTETNDLVIAALEVPGVERETGAVALMTQGQLQLQSGEVSEQLLRIDARELPTWAAGQSSQSPALSFRYLRPGWRLPVRVRRFEDAAVLQGLVDNVVLRTVVADDGQHMTQIHLSIRNNGRQSLAVTLPLTCEVWSAFVDGQPVRPGRSDGVLLLPLERTGADEAPMPVELTYVGEIEFPRSSGTVELVSPRLDLPLKDARWELFLPPDFAYSRFKGTMSYESADLIPITQDFTLAEYQRQEISKKESFKSQALDFLQRTRKDIAKGKLVSAGKVSQYRSQVEDGQQTAQQLKQLEEDLNRAQGSNLLLAQENYFTVNAQRFGVTEGQTGQGEGVTQFDAGVAEQQVAQLQKAQAIAETHVTPLRVNLPTRGLRYSFVQVLQTETDKPLTIRMRARNERETGWFKQGLLWSGGFLALWLVVAVSASVRSSRRDSAG